MPQIQQGLFDKALAFREANTKVVENYEDFKQAINDGNFVKAYWIGDGDMEAKIKKETKATVRCIPFGQPKKSGTCFYTGKPAEKIAIFGKSY